VVIGGAIILYTGFNLIDPILSLLIIAVILWSTWGLLRESLTMALNAVPAGIDPEAVEAMLTGLPGVARVHHLHIWPTSTTEAALTAHLVMPGGHPGDAFLRDIKHRLAHDFRIDHTTVQIELGDGAECPMHAQDHGEHEHHGHAHG
jgi:cobalt-zinc-cadmium efflux system protein